MSHWRTGSIKSIAENTLYEVLTLQAQVEVIKVRRVVGLLEQISAHLRNPIQRWENSASDLEEFVSRSEDLFRLHQSECQLLEEGNDLDEEIILELALRVEELFEFIDQDIYQVAGSCTDHHDCERVTLVDSVRAWFRWCLVI